jgi:hypothetical protein
VPEFVFAGVLFILGLRSLVYWWGRDFGPERPSEHVLRVLFVTARVGTWFALAAFFVGYALVDYDPEGLGWYLLLLIGLASIQLLASFFLSRGPRTPRGSDTGAPPAEG